MSPDRCYRFSRKDPGHYMLGSSQSNLKLSNVKLSLMRRKSFKSPKHRVLILEAVSQAGASLFSHSILCTGGGSLSLVVAYSLTILNIPTLGETFNL